MYYVGIDVAKDRRNNNFVCISTPYSPDNKLKKILILNLCV